MNTLDVDMVFLFNETLDYLEYGELVAATILWKGILLFYFMFFPDTYRIIVILFFILGSVYIVL